MNQTIDHLMNKMDNENQETPSPTFKEEIQKMFQKHYNQGVEDCMKVVEHYGEAHWRLTSPHLMAEHIIKLMETLKNNPETQSPNS